MATALEVTNNVLTRLRDETVSTIEGADEDVLLIVRFVNDAYRKVADAHEWNQQESTFALSTVAAQNIYSLTNTQNRAILEDVLYVPGNRRLVQQRRKWYRDRILTGAVPEGDPTHWIQDGVDASGDTRLRLYPTPSTNSQQIDVYYYQKPYTSLALDADTLDYAPQEPVELLAWAYAQRERGEVTGQTAQEIFSIANDSLRDHIAIDVGNDDFEEDWYTV